MSTQTYRDMEQGTPEWLEARRGIVTASEVGKLVTPSTLKVASNATSRGLVATLAAERITGVSDPAFMSDDMLRGQLEEPFARESYARWAGVEVEQVGFMAISMGGTQLGYSPDGLVGGDGLIEIKSRTQKVHVRTILDDAVPAENLAQIQCGLLVSGREWCDYVSYCGGMRLWVKRVYPDPVWHEAIRDAVTAAELAIREAIGTYESRTADLPLTERNDFDITFGD